MNENVDYVAKKPNKSTKLLWWCAGADEKILQYCSYSDHIKYSGIGGVVLATSFMALLSMGFALHTIFDNWAITILIAIAWALIVFNLDRFIVSSTGKGDGESSISWNELANASPRLLMAILLGLTISAPLETKIFSVEIKRSLEDTKRNNILVKIDQMEATLPQMTHFILPGGHTTVSFCHIARCVCRRAERLTVALNEQESINQTILMYLNRLSDYLFVLARKLSHDLSIEEIKWIPEKL